MICVKLDERKWCDGQSSSHTAVVGTGGADRNNEPLIGILNKDGICCTGIKQTGKLKRDVYAADGKFNHFELFLVPEISEGR
jgi:hypothetical protein